MSDDGLPFYFEGFSDEEIGNGDDHSDPNVNVDAKNPQPIDETESEFVDSENYLEEVFPGEQNSLLSFNSANYTTAVPINFTSTPVGSPETSRVGTLVA